MSNGVVYFLPDQASVAALDLALDEARVMAGDQAWNAEARQIQASLEYVRSKLVFTSVSAATLVATTGDQPGMPLDWKPGTPKSRGVFVLETLSRAIDPATGTPVDCLDYQSFAWEPEHVFVPALDVYGRPCEVLRHYGPLPGTVIRP